MADLLHKWRMFWRNWSINWSFFSLCNFWNVSSFVNFVNNLPLLYSFKVMFTQVIITMSMSLITAIWKSVELLSTFVPPESWDYKDSKMVCAIFVTQKSTKTMKMLHCEGSVYMYDPHRGGVGGLAPVSQSEGSLFITSTSKLQIILKITERLALAMHASDAADMTQYCKI